MAERCVRIWLGCGSRYSYLAATQVAGLEARTGWRFDPWPVASPDLIRAAYGGKSPFVAPTPGTVYDPAWRDEDAARWAAFYGVPYHAPTVAPEDARALACLCWRAEGAQARWALVHAIYDALFAHRQTVAEVLEAQVDRAGLVPAEAGQARHQAAMAEAQALGIFGVPTVDTGDALFWGNDRLVLVEHHLKGKA